MPQVRRYRNFADLPQAAQQVVTDWEAQHLKGDREDSGLYNQTDTQTYIVAMLNAQVGSSPTDIREARKLYKSTEGAVVKANGIERADAANLIGELAHAVEENLGRMH